MQLASKFGRNIPVLRSNAPLSNEQISTVAPSIFAEEKHDSRSVSLTAVMEPRMFGVMEPVTGG